MSYENPNPLGNEVNSELARVSVKIPMFWKANPELWFYQVEAQFLNVGIVQDDTKYNHVVAAVDTEVLACVSDILRSPPPKDKYRILKERIIAQYAKTENARLRSLLQDIQLGDKRPSQLLREMQDLSQNKLPNEVLRTLWLQRLPVNVQQILSVSLGDLETISEIADKIAEVSEVAPVISEVNSSQTQLIKSLQVQVEELSQEVKRLSRTVHRSRADFRKSRSRSKSRQSHEGDKKQLCWYHAKFLHKARKCIPPCRFLEN